MNLNEIRENNGAHVARVRRGRGIGSGKGKTSGHGHKGQKSRSGVSLRGFEGGQMPLYRRLPKRGFNNIFRLRYAILNLSVLQEAIDRGKLDPLKLITEELISKAGLMRNSFDGVRVLANGVLKSKVNIEVSGASKTAIASIEKLGGTINLKVSKKDKEAKSKKRMAKSKKNRVNKVENETTFSDDKSVKDDK